MKTLLIFTNYILEDVHYYLLPEATFRLHESFIRHAHGNCLTPETPKDSGLSFISVATAPAEFTPKDHPFYQCAGALLPFEVDLDTHPLEGENISNVFTMGIG